MSTATPAEGTGREALPLSAIMNVLADIAIEQFQQIGQWGEQDHPSLDQRATQLARRDGVWWVGSYRAAQVASHYGLPSAEIARQRCQSAARTGHLSWTDILVEEVAEAVEAAALHGDGPELRGELVQIAAVAATWARVLDRRAAE